MPDTASTPIHLTLLAQKFPVTWCGLSRFACRSSINPANVTCPDCLSAYRAEVPEE